MAAAAARARVTGPLMKEGTEGAPPLPSSPGSQIFVVGGGASELVVLVVVSGEHGGNSGEGWGPPPDPGVHATQLLPPVSDQCCLPRQTAPQPHPSGRFWLLPPGTQMTPSSSGPCENVQTARTRTSRGWTDRGACGSHTGFREP